MKINRKKGYFSISAVAKMFSIHQQTVRLYEKEGLINPKRSAGNTRLFSEEDVEKLEEVIYLTHELGINLAGVDMILKLKKQIKKMQDDMNKIFETTQEQLEKEATVSKESVKESVRRLALIKKTNAPTDSNQKLFMPPLLNETNQEDQLKTDNEEYWQIEYEE
jgi:MerR family transcriptional regulator/heat shock protein HspR